MSDFDFDYDDDDMFEDEAFGSDIDDEVLADALVGMQHDDYEDYDDEDDFTTDVDSEDEHIAGDFPGRFVCMFAASASGASLSPRTCTLCASPGSPHSSGYAWHARAGSCPSLTQTQAVKFSTWKAQLHHIAYGSMRTTNRSTSQPAPCTGARHRCRNIRCAMHVLPLLQSILVARRASLCTREAGRILECYTDSIPWCVPCLASLACPDP